MRASNQGPPVSSMEGIGNYNRCLWKEDGPQCERYVKSSPWHDYNRKHYCGKHREVLAEREAEAWIKKDPKLVKYVNI